MQSIIQETRPTKNNVPLPVHCLLMNKYNKAWVTLHYHEYFELLYPSKGDYQIDLNGEIYKIPEHSMFIVNSNEPHCVIGDGDGEKLLLCIKFMPQVLFSSEQSVTELEYIIPYMFERFGSQRLFLEDLLNGTVVLEALNNVINEFRSQQFGHELAIRAEVLKVFLWIIRYWYRYENKGDFELNSSIIAIVSKAKAYVNDNFTEATLESTAEHCGLSYSYLSRVFKKGTSMSFSDYLNFVRVNSSVKLLATDQSITDIALSCGFSSTSYYIKTFKAQKNISPNKFRKMLRK